jgi:heat-inducible transcriptional repressor
VDDLNPRQQEILRVIVSEYVDSARPVGSEALVEKYDLRVSSATVRNVMSALEAAGYIYHPHTSAGRVPSDRGYRFFVDHLMGAAGLSAEEQESISQHFQQLELPLDEWIQLAASVLAQTTASAALVTLPLARLARLRHLDLFSIHGKLALLVIVLQEGIIRKQIVDLGEEVAEDALNRVANRLDETFRGLSASEIADRALEGPSAAVQRRVQLAVATIMRALDQKSLKDIWFDGVTQILTQPEFANVERLRELLDVMEHPEAFAEILGGAYRRDGVNLLIGGENPAQSLKGYTVVLQRYSVPGEAGGVLGLIGPTRMRYDRAIASVKFIAELLGHFWGNLRE